jgi:hypothetical protein
VPVPEQGHSSARPQRPSDLAVGDFLVQPVECLRRDGEVEGVLLRRPFLEGAGTRLDPWVGVQLRRATAARFSPSSMQRIR